MKKLFKSMMALSLGLALVMTGCDKDNNDPTPDPTPGSTTPDSIVYTPDSVVGTYGIEVFLDLPVGVSTTDLVVVKEGANDLKVDATVTVVGFPQGINISLKLSSLKEVSITTEDGAIAIGFYYKIAPQVITVLGEPYQFTGVADSDYYFDGIAYDGFIGTLTKGTQTGQFVAFAIKGDVVFGGVTMPLTIDVVSDFDGHDDSDDDDDDTTAPMGEEYIGTWNLENSAELIYAITDNDLVWDFLSEQGLLKTDFEFLMSTVLKPSVISMLSAQTPIVFRENGTYAMNGSEVGSYITEENALILKGEDPGEEIGNATVTGERLTLTYSRDFLISLLVSILLDNEELTQGRSAELLTAMFESALTLTTSLEAKYNRAQ